MKYRKLGKTGLETSVIGMGTDQFYGEWGQNFSQIVIDKIIDKAHSLGINFIDTAECYGDHLSESFIGNSIRDHRDKWIVATKFGHYYYDVQTVGNDPTRNYKNFIVLILMKINLR